MANTLYDVLGSDIDPLFEPIRGTVPIAPTGYSVSGGDINSLYMSKNLPGLPFATAAIITNYNYHGADLNQLFQPRGYAPGTTVKITYTNSSGTFDPSSLGMGYPINAINVVLMGGGGGGSGNAGAGGGGGGLTIQQLIINNTSQSYQTGQGGNGVLNGAAQPGITSLFGSATSAQGGQGGANGGGGGTGGNGGSGGTSTGAHGGSGSGNGASNTDFNMNTFQGLITITGGSGGNGGSSTAGGGGGWQAAQGGSFGNQQPGGAPSAGGGGGILFDAGGKGGDGRILVYY